MHPHSPIPTKKKKKQKKSVITINLITFFFIFIVYWPIKVISLILSPVNREVGRKQEIPEKNNLTTRKQNLACLTCDPS